MTRAGAGIVPARWPRDWGLAPWAGAPRAAGFPARDDWIAMVGTDILVPEVEVDVTHPDGRMRRPRIATLLLYNDPP